VSSKLMSLTHVTPTGSKLILKDIETRWKVYSGYRETKYCIHECHVPKYAKTAPRITARIDAIIHA
jgi:hypothetical protein